MKTMRKGLVVLAALALAGCADMQNRPNQSPPGATYMQQVRNTGSYGNVNQQNQMRVAGERTWQGRKAFVYENTTTGVNLVTDADTGSWIALARGDAPLTTWEPPIGWQFPLEVGNTWSTKHRFTNHANKTSGDFVGTWKVDAMEDVSVPAGTFRCYKIVYSDTIGTEGVSWWNPETSLIVKASNRRSAKHPAGAGTNDQELVQRPRAP